MKTRSNNSGDMNGMVDKSTPFANYQSEKGSFYFTCRSHHQYYNKLVKETGTAANDWERFTLFYLLASIKRFRESPDKFIFLKEVRPNPQAFKENLNWDEQVLVQLAFYLYTGRDIFKISLLDLFTNLDEENTLIAINAIKLRFNITFELFKK